MDEHRAGDILFERIGHAQFLRPFDVVTDVGRFDAWPRDFQLVVNLNRFELHDPAAAEPGENEILGHLRLRTRRGARRISGDAIVKADRQIGR